MGDVIQGQPSSEDRLQKQLSHPDLSGLPELDSLNSRGLRPFTAADKVTLGRVKPQDRPKETRLPHIVTDNCQRCRFTDCVGHCPVECFHSDDERLYIDPDVCIDCGACIPACPVQAIYEVIDMPDDYVPWIEINAERSRMLPLIIAKQDPLPTAEARRKELDF